MGSAPSVSPPMLSTSQRRSSSKASPSDPMRDKPSGLIVVRRASMYSVDERPDARTNCPRFAERVARSVTSRSWSVMAVAYRRVSSTSIESRAHCAACRFSLTAAPSCTCRPEPFVFARRRLRCRWRSSSHSPVCTLSSSNRAQVQVEAAESAALVGGFLAVHTEALQSIRGLYLDTTRVVQGEQFQSLVSSMSQYANSFRRIWITDTAGRVREQHLFGSSSPSLPAGLDVDTVTTLDIGRLAAAARATRSGQLTKPGQMITGDRGVLMLEPIYVGNGFRGFAGGTITTDAILSSVMQARPRVHGQLVIVVDKDTVAATARTFTRESAVDTASSTLPLPGGGEWRVIVMRRSKIG